MTKDVGSWVQPWLSASKETGASVLQLTQEMYAAYSRWAWERTPGPREELAAGFQSSEISSRIQLLHTQTSALQHWVLIHGCCFKFWVLYYFADQLQLINTFVQDLLLMSNIPRLPESQDKVFYFLLEAEMITKDSDLRMNLIHQHQGIYKRY